MHIQEILRVVSCPDHLIIHPYIIMGIIRKPETLQLSVEGAHYTRAGEPGSAGIWNFFWKHVSTYDRRRVVWYRQISTCSLLLLTLGHVLCCFPEFQSWIEFFSLVVTDLIITLYWLLSWSVLLAHISNSVLGIKYETCTLVYLSRISFLIKFIVVNKQKLIVTNFRANHKYTTKSYWRPKKYVVIKDLYCKRHL